MRREPRQQRAKVMVDTIIEAGFISVARHGLANTTTRHIADIAGISVGTLYQYFADKDAVYNEMQARLARDVSAMLRAVTPDLHGCDVQGAVGLILLRFCDLLRADEGRYLTFMAQAAQRDAAMHLPRVERALLRVTSQYTMNNPGMLRLRNIPVVVYVVINAGVFTLIRYLGQPNPGITLEQLVDGIAKMVAAYVSSEMPDD